MSLNVIAIVLSAVTLGLVTYLLLKLRDQNTLEKGNTDLYKLNWIRFQKISTISKINWHR